MFFDLLIQTHPRNGRLHTATSISREKYWGRKPCHSHHIKVIGMQRKHFVHVCKVDAHATERG